MRFGKSMEVLGGIILIDIGWMVINTHILGKKCKFSRAALSNLLFLHVTNPTDLLISRLLIN